MLEEKRLNELQDYELFGVLLARTGEEPDIVNYFIKPVTLVSSSEAFAFRRSGYAEYIADKLPGMAAVGDDGSDALGETLGDDSGDTPVDEAPAGDTEGGDPLGDPLEDPTSGDNQSNQPGGSGIDDVLNSDASTDSSADQEKKPQIDPDKMLLELANPSESMSDYIYREMVSMRISALLKNPPANARPNDLLMLKRWKSRWLYLVSIACLRDFLSRVSLRLSDVA
jgi:hypothetical protein